MRQAKAVLRMPEVELSDSDRSFRAECWKSIRSIVQDKTVPDRVKLHRCLHIGATYAALTGDDSLFRPEIRESHDAMCKWIKQNMEKIEKRRAAAERDAATGQPMFGE